MKKFVFLFFVIFCVAGCVFLDPYHEYKQEQKKAVEKLKQIDLSDGVSQGEATLLGVQYFHQYVSGCGMSSEAIDEGDHWEVPMAIGYAAIRSKDNIWIDKKSGVMTMKDKPTIQDPITTFGIDKLRQS